YWRSSISNRTSPFRTRSPTLTWTRATVPETFGITGTVLCGRNVTFRVAVRTRSPRRTAVVSTGTDHSIIAPGPGITAGLFSPAPRRRRATVAPANNSTRITKNMTQPLRIGLYLLKELLHFPHGLVEFHYGQE